MKVVQLGILGALILVAGLLYLNLWREPQPIGPVQTVEVRTPEPAALPEAPPPEPAIIQPPSQEKPQPAPKRVKKTRKEQAVQPPPAKSVEVATVSTNSEPRAPEPSPAPVPPPPAVSQEPAAQESKPAFKPFSPETVLPSKAGSASKDPRTVTIPAGTVLTVRLREALDSSHNAAGDVFLANLDEPLVIEGLIIADKGARVEGKVVEARKAGRVQGLAALSVALTSLETDDRQRVAINTAAVEKQGEDSKKSDAMKVGIAAGIGAAIGAIAGGGKGAAIGAGAGGAAGAGGVLVTRGKPARLPAETRLAFSLSEPVTITEKLN